MRREQREALTLGNRYPTVRTLRGDVAVDAEGTQR